MATRVRSQRGGRNPWAIRRSGPPVFHIVQREANMQAKTFILGTRILVWQNTDFGKYGTDLVEK